MNHYRNPPLSLRQMQYAVAVADTGGFGTAADACGVSQPALSAQVAKLEDALEIQLFERHARGVHVTQAGQVLLDRMREVLLQTAQLLATAVAQRDPYDVTLRVGVIPTAAPYLLPEVVRALQARSRSPRVHWLELQTEVGEDALARGELDAMILGDEPTGSGVVSMDLGWEPFLLLVPAALTCEEPATIEGLRDRELLLLEDGHCLRDHTLAVCGGPEAKESPYRATSLPTLVQMVGSGLGVSMIPASAVAVERQRARVRAVPFASDGVGRQMRLAWRARAAHEPVLRELGEVVSGALVRAMAL